MSRLTQLKTPSCFVVGFDEGCKIEELGPLKYLKGKLSIFYFKRVKSKTEAMSAGEKKIIYDLCFKWSSSKKRKDSNDRVGRASTKQKPSSLEYF